MRELGQRLKGTRYKFLLNVRSTIRCSDECPQLSEKLGRLGRHRRRQILLLTGVCLEVEDLDLLFAEGCRREERLLLRWREAVGEARHVPLFVHRSLPDHFVALTNDGLPADPELVVLADNVVVAFRLEKRAAG